MGMARVDHPFNWFPVPLKPSTATSAAFALNFRSRHIPLHLLLRSSFQNFPPFKHLCSKFKGFHFYQISDHVFLCSSSFSSSHTTGGGKNPKSTTNRFDTRPWTNILLAANILIFIAQIASEGKVLLWGAKVNSLIDRGQYWRLVTSSLLHANVSHLMVNCYSLNSIGPSVEGICGPKRFLAVYFCSAIASTMMSYRFSKLPAVGASGAIFGLVGSLAVFIMRHRGEVGGGTEELQHIARVIFANMAIGFMFKFIDNWGHVGGLLGGVATSWLLGPAWQFESKSSDGSRLFRDKAPIFSLINRKGKRGKLN